MQARERYASQGPGEVGDVELVALLLGTGSGGRSALTIAADVLHRTGGLGGLAATEPDALAREVPGIGLARAVRLHAAVEAGRRSLRARALPTRVQTPDLAATLMRPGLAGLSVEELHALYLDRGLRPLALRVLTRGSDGLTVVDPRQVYRPAVALGAVHVVLAHNHPSGDPTPSAMDREVTRRVHRAGQVLGITLVDHLVIVVDAWRSLAQEGVLPQGGPGWSPSTTAG